MQKDFLITALAHKKGKLCYEKKSVSHVHTAGKRFCPSLGVNALTASVRFELPH